MSTSGAVLSTKEDDLQVERIPFIGRKERLEISLGTRDVLPIGEAPSRRESMDMCVDRKRGMTKGLAHDN